MPSMERRSSFLKKKDAGEQVPFGPFDQVDFASRVVATIPPVQSTKLIMRGLIDELPRATLKSDFQQVQLNAPCTEWRLLQADKFRAF